MENRYFYSFIITFILYSLFLYGAYSINLKKDIQKRDKPKIIKISLLEPKPKILEKKREVTPISPIPLIKKPKSKPKPKPKKKIKKLKKSKPKKRRVVKKRRFIRKKVLKKDKTKIKRRLKKTKRVVNRVKKRAIKPKIDYSYKKRVETPSYIIKERYIEEYISTPKPKRALKREIRSALNTPSKRVVKRDLSGEKRAFLSNLRESINANKIYPKRAKRMGLEGVVRVAFDIDRSGNVLNIRTSNAPNILKRAVIRAIRSSFPITIPDSLKSQFPLRDISIRIFFKLQ